MKSSRKIFGSLLIITIIYISLSFRLETITIAHHPHQTEILIPGQAQAETGQKNDTPPGTTQGIETFWQDGTKSIRIRRIPATKTLSPQKSIGTPRNTQKNSIHLNKKNYSFTVTPIPEYSALFFNNTGWTGADGNYSLQLPDKSILWLFGDTFIGNIRNNQRSEDSILVNNTIGIQKGITPHNAKITYFSGETEENKPAAVFVPENNTGWFWIYDAVLTGKGLRLFLIRIERDKDSPLGFKAVGMSMGSIPNPNDSPEKWKTNQVAMPNSCFTEKSSIFFGSAVLKGKNNNHIYIYGIREELIPREDNPQPIMQKSMVAARVRENKIDDFNEWQYYDGSTWTKDFRNSKSLFPGIANEYSVSYDSLLNVYICIYTDNGCSPNIMIRLSENPWGPWSQPSILYQSPTDKTNKNLLVYAAKAHPNLSEKPGELIISFIINSLRFEDLFENAELYHPQFIRINFKNPD